MEKLSAAASGTRAAPLGHPEGVGVVTDYGSLEDEVLMTHYSVGDRCAFDELFKRYEGRAYSYLLSRTGSADRAQDSYQELFMRLHRFRHTFDPRRKFSSWFFGIASRVAIDELRRRSSRETVALGDAPEPSVAPAAESGVVNRDQCRRALAGLTREQAEILLAAKIDGVPYREIAERMGRSTVAVKQIASRALRRLRAAHAAGV